MVGKTSVFKHLLRKVALSHIISVFLISAFSGWDPISGIKSQRNTEQALRRRLEQINMTSNVAIKTNYDQRKFHVSACIYEFNLMA